ncbi:hypothetical protein C0V97_08450 [Asaia sp. W19]|uniref:glycosyltransferase n=1 Tax=unclassified Asaia TaxID=2685023 RepID=UPI000F8EF270|nr:glycosyltransferase [Asaia sp. W19]RUT24474.1 hypothetical protein C0V97_16470 [Asaia sp. W19]RUT26018.1 hypothetical protein C0V97_08450 [Asaia sp. W19]
MVLYVISKADDASLRKFRKRNNPDNNFEIVPSFDTAALDRNYMVENGLLDLETRATDEQVADIFSHVVQWSQCVADGLPRTILGDKSSIPDDFEIQASHLTKALTEPWDLIVWGADYNSLMIVQMPNQLGDCILKYDDHPSIGPAAPIGSQGGGSLLLRLSAIEGMSGYTISPRGASTLMGTLPIREYAYRHKLAGREIKGVSLSILFSSLIEHGMLSAHLSFPPLIVGRLPEDVFTSVGAVGDSFDYAQVDIKRLLDDCLSKAGCNPVGDAEPGVFPKLIHFVETTPEKQAYDEVNYFSEKKPPGVRPFGFSHYMAILSAAKCHPEFRIIVWCVAERDGVYWRAIKEIADIVVVPAPQRVFANPVMHPAHQSDIIRMSVLRAYGGIYLDLDTITLKSLLPLCSATHTVMARELASTRPRVEAESLGNSIILSPPGASFMDAWWDSYKHFDSRYWAHSSTKMPYLISLSHPASVVVLPPEAFFVPSWDQIGLSSLFEQAVTFPEAYVFHLWESMSWPVLKEIDELNVSSRVDTYSLACQATLSSADLDRISKSRESFAPFRAQSGGGSGLSRVFSEIYRNNDWGGSGNIYSGVGSDPHRCLDYINFICHYIGRLGHRVVLDIGCGDFRVGAEIARRCPETTFLAMDLVAEVIAANRQVYASIPNVRFEVLNLVDQVPAYESDLVIVKDVLQHLSNQSIQRAIRNLSRHKEIIFVNYMLTEYPIVNEDKEDGKHIRGGRLDFRAAPFNIDTTMLAKLLIKGSPGITEVVRYRPWDHADESKA